MQTYCGKQEFYMSDNSFDKEFMRIVRSIEEKQPKIDKRKSIFSEFDFMSKKYEYESKPSKCPVCDSERIAKILYGLPSPRIHKNIYKDIEEGRVTLGGDVIDLDKDLPVWQCTKCRTRFYYKKNKDIKK